MSDKKIELIAQMLKKAESTTPEEAEALQEHAERLMVKYMIDQATIDAKLAGSGKASAKIITKVRSYRGNIAGELFNIGVQVSWALDLQTLQSHSKGYFHLHIVGFEDDIQRAEQLIDSLEVQAKVAMKAWWKEHRPEYTWQNAYEQEKARRSFIHGFGVGAGLRIKDSRRTIVEEAGTGTELMLVDRASQVKAYVESQATRKGRARGAAAGGAAAGHGFRAGQQANTGGTAVGQGRGISA